MGDTVGSVEPSCQKSDDMSHARCVICQKELEIEYAAAPVSRNREHRLCCNIVYDGVDCVAFGNYGSSVWDPMDRVPLLGFVICDDCFQKRKHLMVSIVEDKGWETPLDEPGDAEISRE